MRKKEALSLPLLGGSSLLVIFAVLCLTMLALLGLSTVQAQKRLSDGALDSVTAYYAADREAETIYARLRSGEFPEGVEEKDGVYRYQCPISPRQTLYIELTRESGTWTVLRWQAVVSAGETDDILPVWKGQ